MVRITKQEMIQWLQGFLKKRGYQVRQSAMWRAFPGDSYDELSRKLYGIFRRAGQVHIRSTIHDLNHYSVMTLPPLGPPASPNPRFAESRRGGEPPRRSPPNKAPINSPVQIPPSVRVEFLKRSYRFRACAHCGYLDSSREATVCPNCGMPKTGSDSAGD